MSEQDINNEPTYEMPTNDVSSGGGDSGGYLGKSPIKDVIDSAGSVDPSRFWVVWMIIIALFLGGAIFFGVSYLVGQNKERNEEIAVLRKELKECPQKTLDGLLEQQQSIENLKNGVIYNRESIQELKKETSTEIEKWEKLNKDLDKSLKEVQ